MTELRPLTCSALVRNIGHPGALSTSLGASDDLAEHPTSEGATPDGRPQGYTHPEPGFFRAK